MSYIVVFQRGPHSNICSEWLSHNNNNNNAPNSDNNIRDMKSRIGALTQVHDKMSSNIAKLKEEISNAKKKLTAFRKARYLQNERS